MTPERWREVEQIYQSTMDRAPELRDAHLNESCGDDADLRREVESLLKLNSSPVLVDQPAWQAVGELLDNDSSVAIGTQLGPYRIEGVLGAGGMGQVYRARDTRLDRTVAIKVSKEEFNERFGREARAVAALNHPNICTLYDVGPNYLVMELVEGPTLAERIKEGPIPEEEALAIARQIADALEAAHERGIVHRDLKPGNIKIKPDGAVKVLDFGLAKRQPVDAAADAKPEDSPTISMAMTSAGMILGTAAYMSPEQARGKPVDKRADIWAFGVVLHEMLTGQQLFEGVTVTDTLAAVLTKEPDWQLVPAKPRRLLRRCLEKDPKRRLRDIGDAWQLLEAPQVLRPPHNKVAWALAVVFGMVAATMLWTSRRATQTSEKPVVRLDVNLGSDVSLGSRFGVDVILSPDGTRLVFESAGRLFTRRLDRLQATELSGTQGAFEPFFSPDGQWVGFFADSKLKKIPSEGGAVTVLCDASNYAKGGAWGEDGNIIASLGGNSPLSQIAPSGGAPTPITELDSVHGEATHRWPQILPGNKAVLFTAHIAATVGFDEASIELVTLPDRRRKTLQRGATFGRYLPSGHLIYVNKGALFAVPFDLDRLEPRGTPTRVLESVGYSTRFGSAQIDFSRDGTLVCRSGGAGNGMVRVQWVDRAGKMDPLNIKPGDYRFPALSPDGQRLAISVAEGAKEDIWVYDWGRNTNSKLTFDGGVKSSLSWSPDGRYIVFGSRGAGIDWIRADGTGNPQPLTSSQKPQNPGSFTADGKRLALLETNRDDHDLWTVPVESGNDGLRAGKPESFLQTPFDEIAPVFSPDGRWIAYVSNDSGTTQVYVRPFPAAVGKRQISNDGGEFPIWPRTGHELFFRANDGRIMVAAYTINGDSFVPDKPRVWSEKRLPVALYSGHNFDLAPDKKRIVALIPVDAPDEQTSRNHVIFIENFFDELRRRTSGR